MNPERDGQIVALLRSTDRTLEDIGTEFGMTRERVRQIGVCQIDMTARRARLVALHAAERAEARKVEALTVDEAWAVAESLLTCRLCGGKREESRSATCSSRCAKAWPKLRFIVDEDERRLHRLRCAQSVLNHSDRAWSRANHRPEWATGVLAGESEPNRRWASRTQIQLAASFGISVTRSGEVVR